MKRLFYPILSLFFFVVVGCYFAYVLLYKPVFTNIGEEASIFIPQKTSSYFLINKKIDDVNFIDRFILKGFSKIYFSKRTFHYGEYIVNKGDSYFDICLAIASANRKYRKIILIDGDTVFNFESAINNAKGLTGNITEPLLEGYLMPDTYYYLYGDTKNSIVLRAKKAMNDFLSEQILKTPEFNRSHLKTAQEVLIMASIIESEAANEFEKPIISSVFKNRMQKNMRLQTDPTVIYQITGGKYKLNRRLTFADLATKGDYNTYQKDGLPISPINNPSKSSIIAALNPKETSYLYFVLKPSTGEHVFSNEYRVHVQNAEEYRKSFIR